MPWSCPKCGFEAGLLGCSNPDCGKNKTISPLNIHENSILSFHNTDRETRHKMILSVYEPNGEYSDRRICFMLGFSDLNSVRPRITELIDDGILIECGRTFDLLTRRHVRLTRLAVKEEQNKFC